MVDSVLVTMSQNSSTRDILDRRVHSCAVFPVGQTPSLNESRPSMRDDPATPFSLSFSHLVVPCTFRETGWALRAYLSVIALAFSSEALLCSPVFFFFLSVFSGSHSLRFSCPFFSLSSTRHHFCLSSLPPFSQLICISRMNFYCLSPLPRLICDGCLIRV